jgi:tripartite-type tricarboxylate transporter receptor subunit TctC
MKFARRRVRRLAAAAVAAVPRIVWAQNYPTRPVHLIVGFTPGSAADVAARVLADGAGPILGQ